MPRKVARRARLRRLKLHWSLVETFLLLPIRKPMTMISESKFDLSASVRYLLMLDSDDFM